MGSHSWLPLTSLFLPFPVKFPELAEAPQTQLPSLRSHSSLLFSNLSPAAIYSLRNPCLPWTDSGYLQGPNPDRFWAVSFQRLLHTSLPCPLSPSLTSTESGSENILFPKEDAGVQ